MAKIKVKFLTMTVADKKVVREGDIKELDEKEANELIAMKRCVRASGVPAPIEGGPAVIGKPEECPTPEHMRARAEKERKRREKARGGADKEKDPEEKPAAPVGDAGNDSDQEGGGAGDQEKSASSDADKQQ